MQLDRLQQWNSSAGLLSRSRSTNYEHETYLFAALWSASVILNLGPTDCITYLYNIRQKK